MQQDGRTDARVRVAGSLRRRLLLAGLAVIVPVMVGAGLWIVLLSHTSGSYRELASEAAAESDLSVAVLERLNQAAEAGVQYQETGSAMARAEFERLSREIDRELSDADRYDEPREIIAIVSIRSPWGLAKAHIAGEDGHKADQDTFESHMHQAADGLERLMAGSQEEVRTELAATERAARLNWLLGLSAVLVALVLAALLARWLSKSLVRPLEQLSEAARALGEGELAHRVEIKSTTELNEVGSTFNAMADALEEQREELERHAFVDSLTGLANRALFEDRTRLPARTGLPVRPPA